MSKRVVVTGCGLVTPLGNGIAANIAALKQGKSGIVRMPDFAEVGLDSTVAGLSDREVDCPVFTQKNKRFMSANSIFAVAAAYEAITTAGFTPETFAERTPALINGCAGSSYKTVYENSRVCCCQYFPHFRDQRGKLRYQCCLYKRSVVNHCRSKTDSFRGI